MNTHLRSDAIRDLADSGNSGNVHPTDVSQTDCFTFMTHFPTPGNNMLKHSPHRCFTNSLPSLHRLHLQVVEWNKHLQSSQVSSTTINNGAGILRSDTGTKSNGIRADKRNVSRSGFSVVSQIGHAEVAAR